MAKRAPLALAFVLLQWVPGAAAQQSTSAPMDMGALDSTDRRALGAAHAAMSGPMAMDPHMTLTPLRPGRAADSARAADVVAQMRVALDKYHDVRVAEADGFRQFLPQVPQPIYHFTNWRWALEEMFRFDPAKPTALLYRRDPDGRFVLVGAMYTAPVRASLDALDRRIPLAVARWHQHVNWCVPPRGARERWRETRAGQPVFGPKSPIATAAACSAVGGRFRPHIFGWMVHVMAFASADPTVIWSEGHHPHS
ncbi:MAG TPA: hypothetical protein VEU55_07805 [Gemmatimonadales bacterium]|nr:hypothetical protein [Gemmatimonadales bacterium]